MCYFKNEGSHSGDLLNKIKAHQSGDVLLQEHYMHPWLLSNV